VAGQAFPPVRALLNLDLDAASAASGACFAETLSTLEDLTMKNTMILSALVGLCLASAAGADPLIVKSNFSGYTPAELVRTERCEVHADKVRIVSDFGAAEELSFQLTEDTPITLSAGIANVLRAAGNETLESTPDYVCDAPSTIVEAFPGGANGPLVLFTSGGCGTARQLRKGAATQMLLDLVNKFCPTTNDFTVTDGR
jgi:hypothetical protein